MLHRLGPVVLDLERRRLVRDNRAERLTLRECEVLAFLLERKNTTVSREALLAEVWGLAPAAETRAVDVLFGKLRKKIEGHVKHPTTLITERGAGYRLVVESEQNPARGFVTRRCRVDLDAGFAGPDSLTPLEIKLLRLLLAKGAVVSRDQLLAQGVAASNGALLHLTQRLRGKIEVDPKAPQALLTIRGKGLRLVTQEVLPRKVKPTSLVGRESDLAACRSHLDTSSWVTVVGPPGVGKTALARAIGAEANAVFCDLTQCRSQEQVLRALSADLCIDPGPDPLVGINAQLQQGSIEVVILDNCEQLESRSLEPLAQLAQVGTARFLATSRRATQVVGETKLMLDVLSTGDATDLLRREAALYGHELPMQDAEIVAHQLGGLPLALHLAAGQLSQTPALALKAALDEPLRALKTSDDSAWAAIQWSWNLLDPKQQRVLAQSAVFVGGGSP